MSSHVPFFLCPCFASLASRSGVDVCCARATEREIQLYDLGENAVEIELSCLKWRVAESWNPYVMCKVMDTEEGKAVFEIQTPSVSLDKGVASYVLLSV